MVFASSGVVTGGLSFVAPMTVEDSHARLIASKVVCAIEAKREAAQQHELDELKMKLRSNEANIAEKEAH